MNFFWAMLGAFGGSAAVVGYIVLHPEEVEIWVAGWWRISRKIFKGAHKKYVKHDLQGRVNRFTKALHEKCPELHRAKLRLEWIDQTETREAFLADGKVVIRLRRDDPRDYNFVHGVYHFVTTVFLHRAKMYLTKTQRTSIDIFTCTKFIEREKPEVVDFFLRKYLHPLTAIRKSKVTALITRLQKLYEADLYFPIFIQEMQFLGFKVFGRQRDDLIYQEVTGTLDILEAFSERTVGDNSEKQFFGKYCKFAIVIFGKSEKIQATLQPYVVYLNKLVEDGYETVYVLSPAENDKRLESVCSKLGDKVNVHRQINLNQTTRSEDGERKIEACLFVIRTKSATVIQSSD